MGKTAVEGLQWSCLEGNWLATVSNQVTSLALILVTVIASGADISKNAFQMQSIRSYLYVDTFTHTFES